MKRILVTGASGQLGMSIQKIASQKTELNFTFKNSKQLDITNNVMVTSVFNESGFDYCINCAAYTNVEQAEKTPEIAYKVNAEGVKNLALTCKQNNVILIHISTDYVFDGEKKEPYRVDDIPNPINEYGKSKLLGERYIQEFLKEYFIIRTSWLYSKEFGNNFYRSIVNKANINNVIYVTDNEEGSPTDTNDLSNYILETIIMKNKAFGVCHFTNKIQMTWFDFAKKIIYENNLNTSTKIVRLDNYCNFVRRPKYSVLYN